MTAVQIVPLTFLLLSGLAPAQDGPQQKPNVFLQNDRVKNEKESNTRTIDGTVKDASDNPLPDAIVQLKNTKTSNIVKLCHHGRWQIRVPRSSHGYQLRVAKPSTATRLPR